MKRMFWVLSWIYYLVDLVNIDDAYFGTLHIVVGILKKPQYNVLNILPHITGLGECCGIRDAERNVQDAGKRSCQQGLAGAGGPNEKNVALLDLHVGQSIGEEPGRESFPLQGDALVVIVNGN